MASRSRVKRRLIVLTGVAGFIAAFAACASVAGIDGLAVGPCKGGEPCDDEELDASTRDRRTGGGAEEDAPPKPFECPSSAPGPKMVQVGTSTNPYCIDSTEVTVGQYKAFLASSPNAGDQTSECTWNNSFTPSPESSTFTDEMPQVWVDWCDAVAYCKWAGKRLCGKIVDGQYPGTALVRADLAGPNDQWYNACSNNAQKPYPYGATMASGACNLNLGEPMGAKAPGSFPKCVGGSDGIFDMVGNVWEWIDICEDADAGGGPENFVCYARGGSFGTWEVGCTCAFNGTLARRKGMNDQIGFRCCSP